MIRPDGLLYPRQSSSIDSVSVFAPRGLRDRASPLSRLDWEPSKVYYGTLLNRMGGEYPEDFPIRQHRNPPEKEVQLKSSQLMARIEAAGWKRIRSDGSHFTYEHPTYGRAFYGYGRPQTEVGKHKLRDIEARFKLLEIAQQKEVKRMTQKVVPALGSSFPPAVRARPSAPEMTDQTARLLYAQLHHDHKTTVSQIAKAIGVKFLRLNQYLHANQPLLGSERALLFHWLGVREAELGLIRDRDQLRKKGYGARVGTSNASDPWLVQAREAIQSAMVGGNTQTDLARAIGIHPSVVGGILNHRAKRAYPANKQKIQKWIDDNEMVIAKEATLTVVSAPEPVTILSREVKPVIQWASDPASFDQELSAIQNVLESLKSLDRDTVHRVLAYVSSRLQ